MQFCYIIFAILVKYNDVNIGIMVKLVIKYRC